MSHFRYRTFLRLALVGVAAGSLGLAACGRKGPLDLPPGGSYAGESQASVPTDSPGPIALPIGGQVKNDGPGIDANGRPQAPKGPNKRVPLDVLLN